MFYQMDMIGFMQLQLFQLTTEFGKCIQDSHM